MFANYRILTYITLVVIIGFFAVRPQWGATQTLREAIDEYTVVRDNLSTYNNRLSDIIARRDELTRSEHTRLDSFVGLGGIDPAQAIYNLEQVARAHTLSIQDVHTYEPQRLTGTRRTTAGISANDFITQDFEMSLHGTYAAMKSFIAAIDDSLEPYEVITIKFNNEKGSTLISFTVRIRVSSLTSAEPEQA